MDTSFCDSVLSVTGICSQVYKEEGQVLAKCVQVFSFGHDHLLEIASLFLSDDEQTTKRSNAR